MVSDDGNTVMTEMSFLPSRSLGSNETGSEEMTFVLHLGRWITAKRDVSGRGNVKKKSRDLAGKWCCHARRWGWGGWEGSGRAGKK